MTAMHYVPPGGIDKLPTSMNNDPVRIGGLFRCCVQSIREGQAGTDGEIRGCTVGKGCDSHVIFRHGAWEWLRPLDLPGVTVTCGAACPCRTGVAG